MTSTLTSVHNPLWGDDWSHVRDLWSLEPGRAHLNHGSFGAVQTRVIAAQDALRGRLESNPMPFFLRDEPVGVAGARVSAAAFLGCESDELALVPNATTAASTVFAALGLRADDEVVLTDHGYGAVAYAAERFARNVGAHVRTVPIDVRATPAQIVDAVLGAVTERTRVVCVDQITSPTAIALPVGAIAESLAGSHVAVFADAAHAPGQVPVDLSTTFIDFWTGNFHKWPCSPRGTAALYVSPRWRDRTGPLVVSWNEQLGFPASFDVGGTQDLTAWMSLGAALDAMDALGWERMRAHGRALVAYGQQVVADALGVPAEQLWADDSLWMRCIPLPAGVATTIQGARDLWATISDDLRCEVGVTRWRDQAYLRISAHAYNAPAEYEHLAFGLRRLLG